MDKSEAAKQDIIVVISETYGVKVGSFFESSHANEVLPVFVHNSFTILEQNMGKWKANEELDAILSKHGVSVSSYE